MARYIVYHWQKDLLLDSSGVRIDPPKDITTAAAINPCLALSRRPRMTPKQELRTVTFDLDLFDPAEHDNLALRLRDENINCIPLPNHRPESPNLIFLSWEDRSIIYRFQPVPRPEGCEVLDKYAIYCLWGWFLSVS